MPDNVCVGEDLVVAAAQPRVVDGDVQRNAASHVELIAQADARLVVFPELSLTGYALGAPPVALDGPDFDALVSICATTDSVALVGAPVEISGARFIAAVRVDGTGARVAYRKTFLGGHEAQSFCPGAGPVAIDVDGWRVGIGICRDTGVAEHLTGTAALGVDVYACGVVHHHVEFCEQQRRARTIAAACRAPVVMASFAGPTGGGYVRTAGGSAVWSADAVVLAETGDGPGSFARAALPRPARPA